MPDSVQAHIEQKAATLKIWVAQNFLLGWVHQWTSIQAHWIQFVNE